MNPVEQRLVDLQSLWQSVRADDSKRFLLWQAPDNAMRLVHCFFEAQRHDATHEAPYVGGDTFIVFDTGFENSIQYSRALKEALAGQYEASRKSFEQQGLVPDWPFEPTEHPDSASGFVEGLNSLGRHHEQALGHVVAVMLPATVSSEPAWTAWLLRALDAGLAQGVCLATLDSLDTPRCNALAESGHLQLHVQAIPMDAWGLAQETFAQEPAVGAAGVFRSLLTSLFGLVDKGSTEQVMTKASDALAFARRQGWADQEVVVRMLAAGTLLKDKRFDEAVNHYRHARISAEAVTAEGHPAGRQLVLQTWFGEASAHLAADDLAQAAHCYALAEPVAQAIPNPILWIEALRMGAFCHAGNNDSDSAMACGLRVLEVGARMQPEARGMTTLPLATFELLRLADAGRIGQVEAVKHRLDAALRQLHEDTERDAAALERHPDAQALLLALEQAYAVKVEDLTHQAAQDADAVATAGEPGFVSLFEQARALLGASWPLGAAPARAGASAIVNPAALQAGAVFKAGAAAS